MIATYSVKISNENWSPTNKATGKHEAATPHSLYTPLVSKSIITIKCFMLHTHSVQSFPICFHCHTHTDTHTHCSYAGSKVHWKRREEKRVRKRDRQHTAYLGFLVCFSDLSLSLSLSLTHTQHTHARTHTSTSCLIILKSYILGTRVQLILHLRFIL